MSVKKETCSICFGDTDLSRMSSVGTCEHKYCFSCIKHHVEIQLQNGVVARCPSEDCNSSVTVDSCEKFLSPELASVIITQIKESSIPVTEKVYCPYSRCSALMSKQEVLEYSSKIAFASEGGRKCVKCQQCFCIDCKAPWHYDMSCHFYQSSESYIGAEEQLVKSMAIKERWRQCLMCNHMVELDSGCYHITCRCGHQFCYTCGGEWKNKKATCSCPLWDERYIIRA